MYMQVICATTKKALFMW